MIDANNGRIAVSGDCIVSGSLKKSVFMSSSLFHCTKPLTINPPFASYVLPEQSIDGRAYSVSLWFREESLSHVQLCDTGDEFGSSWEDWSEEKEKKRKQHHDRLLVSLLGRSREYGFGWGRIESLFDLKAASSYIVISYNQPIQSAQTTSGSSAPDRV
ncbi:hypothetical protein [Lacunisphaera limnophila]|uniref:hypothetical protein n=1 Tax=Lacunisphaera limnophila TaxID=1838286 RepID=UPI0012FD2CA4|nr:hypothetical protein [Lacunisphaera limnophila]